MQAKTKAFDAVDMKHAIQGRMIDEAGTRTPEDYRKYITMKAAEYREIGQPQDDSALRAALSLPPQVATKTSK